jgi:DNA-3-methyladenine glycosylase
MRRVTKTAPLPPACYDRAVLEVAPDLVGCTLLFQGVGGRIVETEAYRQDDPCSHSYSGRTARNATLFGPPGRLYVYFTYGMHYCANVACGEEGFGAGVLLRALEPLHGVEEMARRRGLERPRLLCSGPARLAQALGLTREHDGLPVDREPLVVLPRDGVSPRIFATPRIGVRGDAKPWRFVDAGSPFLSRPFRPDA